MSRLDSLPVTVNDLEQQLSDVLSRYEVHYGDGDRSDTGPRQQLTEDIRRLVRSARAAEWEYASKHGLVHEDVARTRLEELA